MKEQIEDITEKQPELLLITEKHIISPNGLKSWALIENF